MITVHRIKYQDGSIVYHHPGADGTDYTLCGIALDGGIEEFEEATDVKFFVTCEQCRNVIMYCKGISIRRAFGKVKT